MKDLQKPLITAAAFIVCAAITSVLAFQALRSHAAEAVSSTFTRPGTNPEPPLAQNSSTNTANMSAFTFLPPLGNGTGGNPAVLDTSLLNHLRVEVCEVNGSECSLIRTFTAQGSNDDRLRVTGNRYHVNWHTEGTNPNLTRTVRVMLAGLQLGSVTVSPGEYAGLGSTWPIQFSVRPEPSIRVRLLRSLGKSVWPIVAALKSEFNLCGAETALLMAADLEPYTAEEVAQAVGGVCQDVVIPDTTKIADEQTIAAHTSYDAATGRMVFSHQTDLLRRLRAGDVFVSEPTPAAPFGFLRKITATRTQDSLVILDTVQAKLNEAIYRGTLDVTGELVPDDGTQQRAGFPKAVSSSFDKDSVFTSNIVIDEGDSYNFHRDIDVTVNFDGTEEGVEGSGSLRVQGFAYFNAGYNVGIGIRSCLAIPPACPDRFEAWAGFEAKTRLRVTGNFDGRINKEKLISQIPMKPILFFIGPIPVVLVPEMNLKLGVNGEAHIDFAFEGEAKSVFKAGAKWLNPDYGGNGWNDISEYNPLERRVIEARATAKMRLESYSKVDAKIMLYGVVGPGIDGSLGIVLDADTSRKPLWFIDGHVTTNVNFEASIADIIELGRYSAPILNEYFRIADSPNSPPIFSNVRMDTIFADIGSPVVLGPRSGFQGYFDVVDPEGDAPVLTASSDRDGNIPLTYTFPTPGLRIITVTARDAEGASASITLRVDVKNSLPVVNIYSAADTVPATVQYFVNASAFDPEDGFLTCDRINFYLDSPGTLTKTGSGGTCGATIRFAQAGAGLVRVTATDLNGGVGTSTKSVTVTAVPANLPPEPIAGSFSVMAFRGPLSNVCPDPNYLCEVPPNSILNNGNAGSGDYYSPLFMYVGATDPEGGPVTVEWVCRSGPFRANIVWDNTYNSASCDALSLYSSSLTVEVFAIVRDAQGAEARSEIRTLRFLQRTN